jgi:cytochrome c5
MSKNEQPAGQQSLIKTPQQLIAVISLALLVPVVLFVLLNQFLANTRSVDKDSPDMTPDAVAKRLKPVGDLAFADAGGGAAKAPRGGEEIYKSVCSACHASGAAGAPKLGEKGDWAPRLKQGEKMLVENAIKGVGKMMPARGGNAELSDLEVESAVVYMSNSVGARFKEPAAPVAEKTAAAAPAAKKAAALVPAAAKADGKKLPIKESATAAAQTTTAGAASKTDGKKIYEATCTACHGAGVAGAPKAGDKAAWAPRLKSGMDTLYASALKGKGVMPPKGGNNALADADVKAAVDYLIGLAK